MATLLLRRAHPLTDEEKAALPHGCVASSGEGGVVARAQADGSLAAILALAAAMARAVPDADFVAQVPASSAELPGVAGARAPAGPAQTALVTQEQAAAPEERFDGDPWACYDRGEYDKAIKALNGKELDDPGRTRLRLIFSVGNIDQLLFAIRACRVTLWKSSISNVRRFIDHEEGEVRAEAALAIGELAGYSQLMVLEKMVKDKDPQVRAAAQTAIDTINGRKGTR